MALVSCSECGGAVSTSAAGCPHCGHPMSTAGAVTPAAVGAMANPPNTSAGESVLWQGTPSLRLLVVDAVRAAIFAAVVIGGVVVAYQPVLGFLAAWSRESAAMVAEYAPGFRLATTMIVVTVVGLRLGRLGWRALSLRYHRYRVSNQRLTVETGVVSKTLVEIDMRTVDDILFRQGVIERVLGLGRIDIISSEPGGASGHKTSLALVGVREPRSVRETIRDAVYQATHSQLFTRST